MGDFDTTSISQGGLKLYFNTDVLSDEVLKARVASEVKSLGALVEPDFAKQVIEGKGLTLRRVYCYELALVCDITAILHRHYTTWEKYRDGTYTVSKTALGGYKVEANEKGHFVTYDYDEEFKPKDRLIGIKCLLYPNSESNSILPQSWKELEWTKNFLSNDLENYSTQPSIEYAEVLERFNKLSNEKIMKALTSKRAFSSEPLDFKSMSINNYYLEKSVARIEVAKYYIYVSYKGQNYNLELDNRGKIVLEKSTFPIPQRVYSPCLSKEEIHKLFVDSLKAEGEKVDKDFLAFVSDIRNVEISSLFSISKLGRVKAMMKGYDKYDGSSYSYQARYLGLLFASATNKNPSSSPTDFKMDSTNDTESLLENFKSIRYSTIDASGNLSKLDGFSSYAPNLSNIELSKKDPRFKEAKESLSCFVPSFSFEKENFGEPCIVFDVYEYKIAVKFNGRSYTNNYITSTSTWKSGLEFKLSSSFVNQAISECQRTLDEIKSKYGLWYLGILTLLLYVSSAVIAFGTQFFGFFSEAATRLNELMNGWLNVGFWICFGLMTICAIYPCSGLFNTILRLRVKILIKNCKSSPSLTEDDVNKVKRSLWYKGDSPREDFLHSFFWALGICAFFAIIAVVSILVPDSINSVMEFIFG